MTIESAYPATLPKNWWSNSLLCARNGTCRVKKLPRKKNGSSTFRFKVVIFTHKRQKTAFANIICIPHPTDITPPRRRKFFSKRNPDDLSIVGEEGESGVLQTLRLFNVEYGRSYPVLWFLSCSLCALHTA